MMTTAAEIARFQRREEAGAAMARLMEPMPVLRGPRLAHDNLPYHSH